MEKLVVLGGGESGFGSAVLGRLKGFDVFLSDNGPIATKYRDELEVRGIEYEQDGHNAERILAADLVIKSPGIPEMAPLIVALRERGVPVISEIEFAGRYTRGMTICITGSNGKTTCSMLVFQILRDAGYDAALAGNIGDSFAYRVASDDKPWYVLELSSFQLDGMCDFRADIAVLLNITPDHLDRYGYDMDRYIDSKLRIANNQTAQDSFIYFAGDKNIASGIERREIAARKIPFSAGVVSVESTTDLPRYGAWLDGGDIVARYGGENCVIATDSLKIKGLHNHYNVMAASLAALAAGVPGVVIEESVKKFGGVEHRLEYAGTLDGADYINDSKATNTDAAWYALESMTNPVVWIAGGTDKGNDYTALKDLARGKVKTLVCMGKDNSKITAAFKGVIPQVFDTGSLEEAMRVASDAAAEGDTVLLSPACASFDLFKNYEDRGNKFKEWVERNGGEKTK